MTEPIKFLRHKAVAELRLRINDNLRLYKDGQADFSGLVASGGVQSMRNVRFAPGWTKKIKMPEAGESHDSFNSVLVYESLPLKPAQACDYRIWVHLSHFELRHYVRCRWPLPKNGVEGHILSHYFVKTREEINATQRALLRDNAIARLWWMGHIASRSKHLGMQPIEVLNVLLHHADVRANLLERSLGMNPDIFDAVVSRLAEDYAKVKKAKKEVPNTLFYRDRFRGLMKSLNRIGGYRMLDALGFEQLQNEIKIILAEG